MIIILIIELYEEQNYTGILSCDCTLFLKLYVKLLGINNVWILVDFILY